MPKFNVNVRAIRHLTATITVEAADHFAAEDQARNWLRYPETIVWYQSDAEDEQVESVHFAVIETKDD